MPNTSTTGGYLVPASFVLDDLRLDKALQQAVVGITGLPGNLVRPRWQPKPPTQPPQDTDWAAIGVPEITPDAWAYALLNAEGTSQTVTIHSTVDVLATFYGPTSGAYAMRLQMGVQLPQNLEALRRDGLALLGTGSIKHVPELVGGVWLQRRDFDLQFRYQASVDYAVLKLLILDGQVKTPYVAEPFQPSPFEGE